MHILDSHLHLKVGNDSRPLFVTLNMHRALQHPNHETIMLTHVTHRTQIHTSRIKRVWFEESKSLVDDYAFGWNPSSSMAAFDLALVIAPKLWSGYVHVNRRTTWMLKRSKSTWQITLHMPRSIRVCNPRLTLPSGLLEFREWRYIWGALYTRARGPVTIEI